VARVIGVYFRWRNLKQTQEGTQATLTLTESSQITERFTRAIDQVEARDERGANGWRSDSVESTHSSGSPMIRQGTTKQSPKFSLPTFARTPGLAKERRTTLEAPKLQGSGSPQGDTAEWTTPLRVSLGYF
jgi:hypothetical protein